ncbi:hypothetical protein T459_22960 [Capsicum annuum]|uniref:Pentatricopeptide repeat-containing protein n=1 Tax=Capsicum annuum TaxID=4072 RepID=A0A2G2YR76_CAPAN|nr:hypothetical protein T459_22960 [Capsicum annuum]
MKDSGSLPNVSTYTNLMQQLFRVKEFQKAMNLFNEMTEMGVKLDTLAATTIVAGYISQNRVSKMWKVFENMKGKGIVFSRKSYTIFVNELCKVSRTNDIFRFKMDRVQPVIWPILSEKDKGALDLWLETEREEFD